MIISKSNMREALKKMMERYRVSAPASNGKVTDYLELDNADDIIMDNVIPYKTPKEFYLPRCDRLVSFKDGKARANISEPEDGVVIFGVKSCDLEALGTMAKIFTEGKFKDPFFAANVENNLLIGVGCNSKKPGCFCDSLSVDLNYSDNCDLFLEDNGDDYKVLYVSEKGRLRLADFIEGIEDFVNPPAPESKGYHISMPDDVKKAFEEVDWESIAETCQGCGICTFVCPTCHCFEFRDVEQHGEACRYRYWGSCMSANFTLHASGHNPRESKTERYRQRIMHKFVYVAKNVGKVACTGCGRCVRSCPAGINMQNIVEYIADEHS